MKKTFDLTDPKIKYPRHIEASKNHVRKYLKRERRKTLPEGADFWDFDCKFGNTADEAEVVQESELIACITTAETQNLTSFYVEVLAKPGSKPPKPETQEKSTADNTDSSNS
jgi:hypothetical protein